MSKMNRSSENRRKKLPLWALILLDVLGTCLALGIFVFFHLILPRIQEQRAAEEAESFQMTADVFMPSDQAESAADTVSSDQAEIDVDDEASDTWKYAALTTDEITVTDSSYSSHDIHIDLHTYAEGEGIIKSPYVIADIYVRDVRCIQSYFAGEKYIPTGHGELMLSLMEKSGAILASNGDYYSMQLGSAVLRNGILYRYPTTDLDVFILYDDGSVRVIRRKSIKTKAGWDEAFRHAWQAWSFGPSLLDENGIAYSYNELHNYLSSVVNGRNPRTAIGYFEPGHYCIVVVDGRTNGAPGATMEDLISIFTDLGCAQAYNLDGGGSSMMAFNGEFVSQPSADRKLPDIILVTEYEGSFAQREIQSRMEGQP